MRRGLCILLLGLMLFSRPCVVSAADDLWIVSTTLGGSSTSQPLSLSLTDTSNQVNIPLYIRRANPSASDGTSAIGASGAAATKTIQLFVQLTNKETEEPLPDFTVNIKTGITDVTATGLTVPLDGRSVQFVVSLGSLTQIGTFQGTLMGQSDEGLQQLAELTIQRFPKPVLTLVGKDASGALRLTATQTDFQHTFPIASTNQAKVDKLRVFISPLFGPNQIAVTPKCMLGDKECINTEVTLEALGELLLTLSVDLPANGTYTGQITLQYADKRETTELIITRQRPTVSVAILNTAATRTDSKAEVQIWVTLQEKDGLKVDLDAPQITELILTDNNAKFQAAFLDTKFMAHCDDTSGSKTISLQPNEIKTVWVVVCGLAEVGSYSGNLRVSARDREPVSQPVSFVVKAPIWLAAIVIFIGVLSSYILRSFTLVWRPQLDRRERSRILLDNLAVLEKELQEKFASLDDEEKQIIGQYTAWLEKLDADLARGQAEKPDDAITEIDLKLGLLLTWFNLRRRIESLPAPIRETLRQNADWKAVCIYLTTERRPPDAAQASTDATTLRTKLEGLGPLIDDELKKHYQAQLDSLRQQVNNWLKQKLILVNEQELFDPLDRAKQLLDNKEFTDFPVVMEQARARFAEVLAKALVQRLEAVAPPRLPAGFDQPAWEALKREVKSRLVPTLAGGDPAVVIDAYETTYDYYLDRIITKLHEIVTNQQEDADNKINDFNEDLREQKERLSQAASADKPNIEAEIDRLNKNIMNKTDEATRLKSVIMKLEQAQEQRLGRNLFKAEQIYNAVRGEYEAARTRFRVLGVGQGDALQANGALLSGSGAPISAVPALENLLKKLPSSFTLGFWRFWGDLGQLIAVIIIAAILGVSLLWLNNATWGSSGDYLTAFLWGLGLHQISGSAFSGIGSIRQQLTGQQNS